MPDSRLHQLSALGQSVWIDNLSRTLLHSGGLAQKMEEDAVTGVTSNPTIFQKAIAEGSAYDDQMRDLLEHEDDAKEIFVALAGRDIGEACDLMRNVWDDGKGLRGWVSFEVDPTLANDTDGTVAEAKRLAGLVDKPNLYVKIPATKPGLPAIEEMIAAGTVDQRHADLLDRAAPRSHGGLHPRAWSGWSRAAATPPASRRSRASSSRASTPRRTSGSPTHPELQGKLAVANAKLAYQSWKEVFAGERWAALEARGASKQWCLWASTSTKNPAYRDVMYVEDLIGPDTVNTMPPETIEAFQDHGEVALTIEDGLDEARKVFEDVEAAGVSVDDVTRVLEEEGVQKFSDSFAELLDGIRAKRGELVNA